MKRIIEIPDKVVEAIQNGEDYRYDIHTAIAQSTPYNPTGDLISREALKKKLQARHDNGEEDFDKGYNIGIEAAIELLDNAPPVEPIKQCKYCKHCGNEDYCSNCHSDHSLFEYYDRSKGEWIIVKDEKYGNNVKCPFCGKELAGTDLNFCCKCGADMRKGGAE